jgi:hypothetical protein
MPGAGLESIVRPFVLFTGGAILAAFAAVLVVRISEPVIGAEPDKISLLLQLLLAGAVAAAVYAVYTRLLNIPELGQTLSLIRSLVRRRRAEE